MSKLLSSGDIGFCEHAGHSGSVLITWDGDQVVKVECGFGNHETCGCADTCELYQRAPISFTKKPTGGTS